MSELIIGVVAGVASGFAVVLTAFVVSTFSLSIARTLRLAWVRSITKHHSRAVRAARLCETESYISDMEEDLRRQGYTPGQIALRMTVDLARSIPADITWRPQRIELTILTPSPVQVAAEDIAELLKQLRDEGPDIVESMPVDLFADYQKSMSADRFRQIVAKMYGDTEDADRFTHETLELIRASRLRAPDDDA